MNQMSPNNYDSLSQKITELATNFNNLFQSFRDHKREIENLSKTNQINEKDIAILEVQIQALKNIQSLLPELIDYAKSINIISENNETLINEILEKTSTNNPEQDQITLHLIKQIFEHNTGGESKEIPSLRDMLYDLTNRNSEGKLLNFFEKGLKKGKELLETTLIYGVVAGLIILGSLVVKIGLIDLIKKEFSSMSSPPAQVEKVPTTKAP